MILNKFLTCIKIFTELKKSISISEKNDRICKIFFESTNEEREIILNYLTRNDLVKLVDENCNNHCYPYLIAIFISTSNKFNYSDININENLQMPSCVVIDIQLSRILYNHIIDINDSQNDNIIIVTEKRLSHSFVDVEVSDEQKNVYVYNILLEHLKRKNSKLNLIQINQLLISAWEFSEENIYRISVLLLFLKYCKDLDINLISECTRNLSKNIILNGTSITTKMFIFDRLRIYSETFNLNLKSIYVTYFQIFNADELIEITRNHKFLLLNIFLSYPEIIEYYTHNESCNILIAIIKENSLVTAKKIELFCTYLKGSDEDILRLCSTYVKEDTHLSYNNIAPLLITEESKYKLCLITHCKTQIDLENILNKVTGKKSTRFSDEQIFNLLKRNIKIGLRLRYYKYFEDYKNKIEYLNFYKERNSNITFSYKSGIILNLSKQFELIKRIINEESKEIEDTKNDSQTNINKKIEIDEDKLCIICLDNKKIICPSDCGHLCMCATCTRTLLNEDKFMCPLCRKKSKDYVIVYF